MEAYEKTTPDGVIETRTPEGVFTRSHLPQELASTPESRLRITHPRAGRTGVRTALNIALKIPEDRLDALRPAPFTVSELVLDPDSVEENAQIVQTKPSHLNEKLLKRVLAARKQNPPKEK